MMARGWSISLIAISAAPLSRILREYRKFDNDTFLFGWCLSLVPQFERKVSMFGVGVSESTSGVSEFETKVSVSDAKVSESTSSALGRVSRSEPIWLSISGCCTLKYVIL